MERALQNQERYNVTEYYEAIKNTEQPTELLDGVIVDMASPNIQHQQITGNLFAELRQYIRRNGGTCRPGIAPTDVKLDDFNVVVPDVFIACKPEQFDQQKYNGAPEFVAEVVSSNRNDDFDRKLWLYRINGVREYWIIDPKNENVLLYFFEESSFPNIYPFNAYIPVRIYQDAKESIAIRILDLLD